MNYKKLLTEGLQETILAVKSQVQIGIGFGSNTPGAGKTSVAEWLQEHHGFHRYSISSAIELIVKKIYMVVWKQRDLYQKISEALFNIWEYSAIYYILNKILEDNSKLVVIDDIRRIHEAEILLEAGFYLIKHEVDPDIAIKRLSKRDGDAQLESLQHPIEKELSKWNHWHYVINQNGPLSEAIGHMEEILQEIYLHKNLTR